MKLPHPFLHQTSWERWKELRMREWADVVHGDDKRFGGRHRITERQKVNHVDRHLNPALDWGPFKRRPG
jgi:hypothetical protein